MQELSTRLPLRASAMQELSTRLPLRASAMQESLVQSVLPRVIVPCATRQRSCPHRRSRPWLVKRTGSRSRLSRGDPGTCGRVAPSRRRPGNGQLRPIPARPSPARRAGARSLPGGTAPAGRARCRRPPAQLSRSRPHRTPGKRPRRRRRSKGTRKNMRLLSSSTPSPSCRPALHRYRAGTSRPDTTCRPHSECHQAITRSCTGASITPPTSSPACCSPRSG